MPFKYSDQLIDNFDEFLAKQYGSAPDDVDNEGPTPGVAFVPSSPLEQPSSPPEQPSSPPPPEQVSSPPEQVSSPSGRLAGQSVGVSTEGYNLSPEKDAQVRRLVTPLEREIQASGNQIIDENQATVDALYRNTQERQGLIEERGQKEAQLEVEKGIIAEEEQGIHRERLFKERLGREEARLKEEAAMNDYLAAVKQFEASSVNPGKLWNDMSGSDKFGTALAVFAHGFLSTKGINTSTMDNLNSAIRQNIDAQIENINKKGRAAGMFKQIYDMVRATSASEAEARDRLFGFQLAEFKAGVVGRLAGMNSDFAKLRAQEFAVAADEAFIKNADTIRTRVREELEKDRVSRQDFWYKQQQLKLEKSRLNLAYRAQQAQEAPKPEKIDLGEFVIDPTPGATNKALQFIPGLSDAQKGMVRDKVANTTQLLGDLQEYMDVVEEIGAVYDGPLNKISAGRNKELYAKIQDANRKRERILNGYVHAKAATTFTEAFVKRIEPLLSKNSFLYGTAKSSRQSVGDFMRDSAKNQDQTLNQYTQVVPPQVAEYVFSTRPVGNRGFATGAKAVAEDLYASLPETTTPIQDIAGRVRSRKGDSTIDILVVKKDETLFNAAHDYYGSGILMSSRGNPKVTSSFADMKDIATVALGGTTNPGEEDEAYLTLRILSEKEYFGGVELSDRVKDEAKFWKNRVDETRAARVVNAEKERAKQQEARGAADRGFRPPNMSYVGEDMPYTGEDSYLNDFYSNQ